MTLFNCFVMGTIEDSLPGILRGLSEGAITLQQGDGIGYDFSILRPKGMRAKGVGAIASGPVSLMTVRDALSNTMMSTGPRRDGADFCAGYHRSVLGEHADESEFELTDYAMTLWRGIVKVQDALPRAFVTRVNCQ